MSVRQVYCRKQYKVNNKTKPKNLKNLKYAVFIHRNSKSQVKMHEKRVDKEGYNQNSQK